MLGWLLGTVLQSYHVSASVGLNSHSGSAAVQLTWALFVGYSVTVGLLQLLWLFWRSVDSCCGTEPGWCAVCKVPDGLSV